MSFSTCLTRAKRLFGVWSLSKNQTGGSAKFWSDFPTNLVRTLRRKTKARRTRSLQESVPLQYWNANDIFEALDCLAWSWNRRIGFARPEGAALFNDAETWHPPCRPCGSEKLVYPFFMVQFSTRGWCWKKNLKATRSVTSAVKDPDKSRFFLHGHRKPPFFRHLVDLSGRSVARDGLVHLKSCMFPVDWLGHSADAIQPALKNQGGLQKDEKVHWKGLAVMNPLWASKHWVCIPILASEMFLN